LGPPRLVHVLGEAQVRIEGLNRGRTERYIGEKNAQDYRKGVARPVKAARNNLPHGGSRKTARIIAPGPMRFKRAVSISRHGEERVLGQERDLPERK